jgi:hypothetical protein
VDGNRVLVIGENETQVLDPNGKHLLAVPVHALAAQLSGLDLVVAVKGQLRDYDAMTGTLLHAWPLPDVPSGGPCGGPHPWGCPRVRFELEGVARGIAAYVEDGDVHILRLSDGSSARRRSSVGAAASPVVFPPEGDSGGFIFGLTLWPAGKTHVLRQRLSFELGAGEDGTWF